MYCHFEAIEYENCEDYHTNGYKYSGNYYIYVDGFMKEVYCKFEAIGYETCEDYLKKGYDISGNYYVYLDGQTFEVFCEFKAGKSYTLIM